MLSRRDLLFGRSDSDQSRKDLLASEQGVSAIEYGLIAGLIGVVLVGSLTRVGKRTRRNLNCAKRAMRGKKASKFCKRRGA